MMPSVIISVWMPRSFLSLRNPSNACGMRPMPNSIVEPSSTNAARFSAICRVISSTSGGRHFEDRRVDRHEEVDVVDVDERIAQRAGHVAD